MAIEWLKKKHKNQEKANKKNGFLWQGLIALPPVTAVKGAVRGRLFVLFSLWI